MQRLLKDVLTLDEKLKLIATEKVIHDDKYIYSSPILRK